MSMQTLMSAAHAAGYAMAAEEAAEEVVEPRTQAIGQERTGTALAVRAPRRAPADVLKALRVMRRMWLREWLGGHWPGRAAA